MKRSNGWKNCYFRQRVVGIAIFCRLRWSYKSMGGKIHLSFSYRCSFSSSVSW